jgi:hypothetical protein
MPRLIIGQKVLEGYNPLEDGPMPEYVPPVWDGPHVGRRLIEAFKTLARLPMSNGPREFGSFWPEMLREWFDENSQQGADLQQREEAIRAANRARIMPSAEDVSRMKQAISWPGHYLGVTRSQLARTVGFLAMWRARERETEWIARRLRLHRSILRSRNRAGLDLIAAGLRHDAVAVF